MGGGGGGCLAKDQNSSCSESDQISGACQLKKLEISNMLSRIKTGHETASSQHGNKINIFVIMNVNIFISVLENPS